MAAAKTKRSRCPGHARHWFVLHGMPGARTPVCVRCGAPNPKPLKPDEWDELEAMVRANYRVGRRVFVAIQERNGRSTVEDDRGAG